MPKNALQTSVSTRPWFIILGILIIATLAFLPSLGNDFVNWDDSVFLTSNPFIKSITPENLGQVFLKPLNGRFYPLSLFSFMIEYRFFALNPFIFHLDNLVMHLVNVTLVFFILRLLNLKPPVYLLATLLFAVHPLQVESVAWISSRKDVLFAAFYLSAILCYLKSQPSYPRHRLAYFIMYAFFFLAMLSKPMAVTFPLVILLIEYYRKQKLSGKDFLNILPVSILGLLFCVLTLAAARVDKAFAGSHLFPLMDRFFLSNYFIWTFLKKILVPYPLSCIYPIPDKTNNFFPPEIYVVSLLIIPIILMGIWSRRSRVPVLYTLVTLFPVLHLIEINTSLFYERFTYLPSIGIFLLMAGGIERVFALLEFSKIRTAVFGVLGLMIMTLCLLTAQRCLVWKNSEVLWTDVIRQFPLTPNAYINRADHYVRIGNYELAMTDLNRAIKVSPEYAAAYYSRGVLHQFSKNYNKAVEDYSKAIAYKPDYFEAYNNRGNLYSESGNSELALADYTSALSIDKNSVYAYLNRGIEYYHKGELEMALQDFLKALYLEPANAFARKMCETIIWKQKSGEQ